MARKTWAYYPSTPIAALQGHKLRVEIGSHYVACSVSEEEQPIAFEFFELDNDINEWSDIIFEVKSNSLLLNSHSGSVDIRYNFKEVLLVPMEKLTSAAAADYLTLIHGNALNHEIKHDKIADQAGMLTIYRVKSSIVDQALRHFHLFQAQHVYTDIINQLLIRTDLTDNFLKIQVYPNSFIAVLMIGRQVQMIQTFSFETTEDICFYLLSILKEYAASVNDTSLEMSGFIEPHGELHRRLQQLFNNRHFHNLQETAVLSGMLEHNHPHTFTPFFNSTT